MVAKRNGQSSEERSTRQAPQVAEGALTLRNDGDDIERKNWDRLEPHVHRYEEVWLTLVAPLRGRGSIQFRKGIDGDFEEFAMCHYTTYVNLARALEKMESRQDDLKFADEIWSNLQHSAEVATKAIAAYKKIYLACSMPRRDPKINISPLEKIIGVLKRYRNSLHDPIIGTAKRDGVRLFPKAERLDHYHRWTAVMYDRRDEDFVPVEELLWSHFRRLASALQGVWGEILLRCDEIKLTSEFRKRQAAGEIENFGLTAGTVAASGTFFVT